jgi:uncharacterized membrane protein
VFAVAITLLALNLVVDGPGHGALLHQLGQKWPAFLAYVVSFFMIGIIWVNHHVLFQACRLVDRTVLFLNLVLLMFVVVIPFTTSTVAAYHLHNSTDGKVAMAMYALAFFGMSIGFGGIFEWTLHGDHRHEPLPPQAHWPARIRFVSGGLVYLVATLVTLVSTVASFVIIAAVAVYYILERTPTLRAGEDEGQDPAI